MKPTKQQLLIFLVSLILVCALSCGATALLVLKPWRDAPADSGTPQGGADNSGASSAEDQKSLDQLISIIRELSLYELDETPDYSQLLRKAIVASTGDPYAAYFTAEEYAEYTAGLNGEFVGIGVAATRYLTEDGGEAIRLLCVYEGSPAEQAGLRPGDLITHVGDTAVSEVGYADALSLIAGDSGTAVTLTYVRDGVNHSVEISRAKCVKQTVFSRTFTPAGTDKTIGYVMIVAFDSVTTRQFISCVEALEAQNVDGLVFDLRYNGGGYLRTVCEMLAYLLPDGDICTVDYRSESATDYTISSSGNTLNWGSGAQYTTDSLKNPLPVAHQLSVPVCVLTNGSTASAAELFTSALRDYGGRDGFVDVTLVGEKTYGKGCMQTTYRLSDGSYVKLTVALYNPPCGVNYNGVGITPDQTVRDSAAYEDLYLNPGAGDPVLDAALAVFAPAP